MPANYEMIISHSPPVFSHSPPNGFLNDYKAAGFRFYDPSPHAQNNINKNNNNNNNQINQNQSFHHNLNNNNNITSNICIPLTTQRCFNQNNNNNNYGQNNIVKPINFKMVPQIKPKRPCLRKTIKQNDINNNNNNDDMDNDSNLNNWWMDDFDNSDDDLDDDEDDVDTNIIINDDTNLILKDDKNIIINNDTHINKAKSISPINIPTPPPITANLNNSKAKKRVVFADDQGLELEHIRIMSEPSNVPPFWSLKFLAHVTQGLISPVPPEQWTIDFRQPASDYLDFRRRLEENKVSLENVIVRENESIVVGTVKVKNLSFHKEVVVRATWDAWKSQEDIFCNYSQIGGSSGAYVLYDTFSFKITLPPSSRKLEFCVCYRCDNKEYWDNNLNKNYCLTKRASSLNDHHHDVIIKLNDKNGICKMIQQQQQINEKQQQQKEQFHNNLNHIKLQNYKCGSYAQQQAKLQSWSEFAPWNHLDNTSPYW